MLRLVRGAHPQVEERADAVGTRHETGAELVINFGPEPLSIPVTGRRIRFQTHPDVVLAGELSLPPGQRRAARLNIAQPAGL